MLRLPALPHTSSYPTPVRGDVAEDLGAAGKPRPVLMVLGALLADGGRRDLRVGRSLGGDYEFFSRPEWPSIRETHGLTFRGQRTMDPSLMYQAVASGDVDVISAFSTDGRIAGF